VSVGIEGVDFVFVVVVVVVVVVGATTDDNNECNMMDYEMSYYKEDIYDKIEPGSLLST
jgi:hypothetical protein